MSHTQFYTMIDYCNEIRQQINTYNNNGLNISVYGDVAKEFFDLMNKPELEDAAFYLMLSDLLGTISRVTDSSLPKWVGGEETFTGKKFIETMKSVW